jgi:hypothetical protein
MKKTGKNQRIKKLKRIMNMMMEKKIITLIMIMTMITRRIIILRRLLKNWMTNFKAKRA